MIVLFQQLFISDYTSIDWKYVKVVWIQFLLFESYITLSKLTLLDYISWVIIQTSIDPVQLFSIDLIVQI